MSEELNTISGFKKVGEIPNGEVVKLATVADGMIIIITEQNIYTMDPDFKIKPMNMEYKG